MSEELVNQLTLNYLISHTQLQKLNKKIKENQEDSRHKEVAVYKDRLIQLFNDLLVNQQSEDILLDVKIGFDNFIDKSVYYFKLRDANTNNDNEEINEDMSISNDEDDDEDDDDTDEPNTDTLDPIHVTSKPRNCKRIPSGTNLNSVPINWFTTNLKKI